MNTMTSTEKIAADVFAEAGEDYVGLWQLFRSLPETGKPTQDAVAEVIAILRQLLTMPGVRVGQFEGTTFVPWTGGNAEVLTRLENQLRSLGRYPDIGEVAWLTRD
jgi:hypothetical protein